MKIPENQRYNWDMIPYVAAAIRINEPNPNAVYDKTLDTLKVSSPHARNILKARQGRSSYLSLIPSAESLRQQLVWFVTKPVYVWSLWTAKHIGYAWDKAPAAVNIFSYLLAAAALACMAPSAGLAGYWLLALAAWLPFSGLDYLSTFATPDLLAFALVLVFMAIEMRGVNRTWSVICCMLIIYTRADLLPLIAGIMLLMRMPFTRASIKQSLAVLVLLLGLLAVMYRITGYPGWQAHMVYALQYKNIYPETFNAVLHFDTYAGRFKEAIFDTVLCAQHAYLIVLSAAFLLWEGMHSAKEQSRKTAWLVAVVWLAWIARLLLFPNTQERFYRIHVSLIELLLFHNVLQAYAAPLQRRVLSAFSQMAGR